MTAVPAFPRKGRRLLVEFVDASGTRRTGFVRDLSLTGLFVVCDVLPSVGHDVVLSIHLPRGKVAVLSGKVVRQGRGSTAVPGSAPIGFGVSLTSFSEEFTQLVASL